MVFQMRKERMLIPPEWEKFLRALALGVSEPSSQFPTVRCWNRAALAKFIQQVVKSTDLPSNFPKSSDIISELTKMGWAYPVGVKFSSDTAKIPPSKQFLVIDLGSGQGGSVDPLELLQAYRPDGVICYFSAIAYHELTTQFATHHHIAQLVAPPTPTARKASVAVQRSDESDTTRKFSLGEMLFSYEGTPYYLTKRSSSRLIGVQTRVLGPRTNIRITTLEQTLLDTLHKPLYCGGASVVIEAWEEGVGRLDEDLLSEYLSEIGSSLTLRRVGAIFDVLDFTPRVQLQFVLERGRDTVDGAIALLPGLEFYALNKKWMVMVP